MRKFLVPTKDTTIYKSYPTNNAGLDEILEIGKLVDTSYIEPSYASASARSLIYFDLPTTASVPATASYFLNLKIANAEKIQRNQKILIYRVSQSWEEGSGYFYQDIKNANDGATWKQHSAYTSWSLDGGDFLTSTPSASITLSTYPLEDIRVDVTNIIQPIVSQSLQNTFYGLVLQFPSYDEYDSNNEGNIKVFSTQTHTVHQPTLEIAWDSQTFVTSSTLTTVPATLNMKVSVMNIAETYQQGDVTRINFNVRDEFPLKTFDAKLRYRNKYYLPSSSYYSIIDTQANVTVVPFDEYSKINCDSLGSYIILDTTPLYKGRYYTVKLKVQSGSYTKTITTDKLFKIT